MYKVIDLLEKVHSDTVDKINKKEYANLSKRHDLEVLQKQCEAAIIVLEGFVDQEEARRLLK